MNWLRRRREIKLAKLQSQRNEILRLMSLTQSHSSYQGDKLERYAGEIAVLEYKLADRRRG